jgi:hypothetical protein
MMKLRIEGLSIVPAGRLPTSDQPARADGRSPTWRCRSCGGERHFPGPVSMAAAIPCSACGANALAVPSEEQGPRAQS